MLNNFIILGLNKFIELDTDLFVDIELQREITFNPINRIKVEIHWVWYIWRFNLTNNHCSKDLRLETDKKSLSSPVH